MRTFEQYINEKVSPAEFRSIELFADRLFSELGIDVEFTKHFKDRVNDRRNDPPISAGELAAFFQKAFRRKGAEIAKLGKNSEALLNDIVKELNLPFVYKWDGKNHEFDLVAKTIMRKANFKTKDKVMRF